MYSIEKPIIFPSHSQIFDSVFWSEDNQISITTPETVYILTPSFPDRSHISPSTPVNVNYLPLSDFRFEVEEFSHDKALNSLKNKTNQDVSFFISYIAPLTYRLAIWTPRSCTSFDGCALIVLYSDYEIVLFHPLSDPAKGKWEPLLHFSKKIHAQAVSKNLTCKFISMACTHHPIFGTLISLGSVEGEISIWQLCKHEIYLLQCVKYSNEWISSLRWSPQANYLCYAEGNGAVHVLQIMEENILLQVKLISSPLQVDPRLVSTLYWTSNESLAIGKANTVCFWNILKFTTQEVTLPSCTVISAMSSTMDNLGLHVFTMDGHMYFIDLVGDPYTIDAVESRNLNFLFQTKHQSNMSSKNINTETNANEDDQDANEEDEDEAVPQKLNTQVGRAPMFLGAASSPNGLFTALFYGISRPFELYFRTDKNSALFLEFLPASSHNCDYQNFSFSSFAASIDTLQSSNHTIDLPRYLGPRYFFWDYLAYFLGFDESIPSNTFCSNVIEYFQQIPDKSVLSTQCSFFLSKYIKINERDLGNVLLDIYFQDVLNKIQTFLPNYQSIQLPMHFSFFLYRLLTLSNLLSSTFSTEVLKGLLQLKAPFPRIDDGRVMHEKCPICEKEVNMVIKNGVVSGLCENGHIWRRCSFTFQILDTAQVRECLGCGFLAALGINSELPQHGTDDPCIAFLMQLQNNSTCYLCGDRLGWCGKSLPKMHLN